MILVGCNKNTVKGPYLYDDSSYKFGNISIEEEVEEINVDWLVGNIIISKQDNNELIIREEKDSALNDDYKFRYLITKNSVDIKFTKSFEEIDYQFRIKNLYLYLPSTVKKITINSHNAVVKCDSITVDTLIIEGEESSINIDKSSIKSLKIKTESEDIILFNNVLDDLEIETKNSNIGILVNEELTNLSIKTVQGNTSLYVSNSFNCNVTFDSKGQFTSKLDCKQEINNYIFNQGKNNYFILSDEGDLRIYLK